MNQAAIVTHYVTHYRVPIFQKISQSDNVEFTVLSGESSEHSIKIVPLNVDSGFRFKKLKNNWLYNKKFLWQFGLLAHILKNRNQSYIFVGSTRFISTGVALILCRILGIETFLWMHGPRTYKKTISSYLKLHLFYKLSRNFLLYNNRSKEIMVSNGIRQDRIHVIYNSLNHEEITPLRKSPSDFDFKSFRLQYFKNEDLPIIVFIGRLNKAKEIDKLLLSLDKLISDDLKSFNLIILGSGSEENRLKAMTVELSLQDRVKFLGEIYDEVSISGIIPFCDLCVTPGDIGLTCIHSLSYGTPVISHDNLDSQMPEVESIIPGYNGQLYKKDSLDNLCYVIDSWLTKYPFKTSKLISDCYSQVDTYYNPSYQSSLLNNLFTKK